MAITYGPNNGLLISANTGEVHDVAFRKMLRALDAMMFCVVKSLTVTAPPGSPANGDRYIVPAGATGAWSANVGSLAVWTTDDPATPLGYWEFHAPHDGWLIWNVADLGFYGLVSGTWVQLRSMLVAYVNTYAELLAHKGVANGYASLDSTGKVPLAQIPTGLSGGGMTYKGTWNATTNSPALVSGVGSNGDLYKVATGGGTVLDGNGAWNPGDLVIFDGTVWEKIDNFEAVTSVASRTGAIVLAESDITSLVAHLAATEKTANKGTAGGYAALDGGGIVPSAQSLVQSVAGRTGAVVIAEADVTSLTTDLAATEKIANKGVASGYASLDGTGKVPAAQSQVMSVAGRTGVIVLAESDITSLTTDLAATEKSANKGVASGYASLDGTGHVPLAQIPAGLAGALQYQGTWDASANSPTLVGGVGTKGFFYKVSVAGTTVIDTATNWHVGDLIIFDGTVWDKIDNYEAVTSVAGRTGTVVLAESDITSLTSDLALLAPLASPALTGSPTSPTKAALDNSTKLATTAYTDTAVGVETTRATTAEALLAPKASPALTGNPTAPTQSALDNSTKVATTAYSDAGVAVEKTRALAAEALLAPLASPGLTGSPTAPTQAVLDNSTKIGTTAYTDAAVAAAVLSILASPAYDVIPFGEGPFAVASTGATMDTTINRCRFLIINIKRPTKITTLTINVSTTANGNKVFIGFYDAGITTLKGQWTFTLTASTGALSATKVGGGSLVLAPGTYAYIWSSDATTPVISGFPTDGVIGTLLNKNATREGQGASGALTVSGVLPANLGTLVAASVRTPAVLVEP